MAFVHFHRVRYFECDMQGHVFNAHYFTWFDTAHTEMWRHVVGDYGEFSQSGHEFVVAEAWAKYRAPASFDDVVDIAVTPEPPSNSSLVSGFLVQRDGELLVEGNVRHVCVRAPAYTKTEWPQAVHQRLTKYADAP